MHIRVPIYESVTNPFEESNGSRVFEPLDDSPLPEWVDVPDGFYVMSCKTRTFRKSQYLTVKFVPKPAFGGFNDGFVKVFPLMEDGSPFPHMNAIYSLIGEHTGGDAYNISDDGEIRDKYRGFPSENNIYDAIMGISSFYDKWKQFPTADNWELVVQLEKAVKDIQRMQNEVECGSINQNIERLRENIKRALDDISKLEGSLTTIYENAADGMNLLEENGIDIDTVTGKRKATT